MLRIAITCIKGSTEEGKYPALGKTTTALGSHEWLINAIVGDIAAPIGVKVGVVTVKVLVTN